MIGLWSDDERDAHSIALAAQIADLDAAETLVELVEHESAERETS